MNQLPSLLRGKPRTMKRPSQTTSSHTQIVRKDGGFLNTNLRSSRMALGVGGDSVCLLDIADVHKNLATLQKELVRRSTGLAQMVAPPDGEPTSPWHQQFSARPPEASRTSQHRASPRRPASARPASVRPTRAHTPPQRAPVPRIPGQWSAMPSPQQWRRPPMHMPDDGELIETRRYLTSCVSELKSAYAKLAAVCNEQVACVGLDKSSGANW